MRLYFSAHSTACLTKQAMRELMKELLASTEVKVRRCVASQIGERMLIEAEASDRATLEMWFEARHIKWEWAMPIELDAHNGTITEY